MKQFTEFGFKSGVVLKAMMAGLLAVVSAPSAMAATAAASDWFDTEYASIRLVSATGSAATPDADTPLRLGLEFRLRENWKIYWRSPGDAGFPPRAEWSDSINVREAKIMWPAPVRFSVLGLETLGYRDEVIFPLRVTPETPGDPVRLGGRVDYLICSDICIPETMTVALDLPSGPVSPGSFAHLINKYEVRVPQPGKANGLTVASLDLGQYPDARMEFIITAHAATGMPFENPDAFLEGPLSDPASVGFGKPSVTLDPSGIAATLRVPVIGSREARARLAGETFTVTLVDGARTVEYTGVASAIDMALHIADGPATGVGTPEPLLATILMLAFLGGLILNLMPCVLPVLSLKILGIVGHDSGASDDNMRSVRTGFLASSAGIVVSFLMIAAALSLLKASGAAVGWGIQFQHPWFLTMMALVIALFACNLWGWFEFRLPGAMGDLATRMAPVHGASHGVPHGTMQDVPRHFMTGMIATLLATPCSAPFLGTAVGFALARGTLEILLIFAVLGLGLAAPYLLVAARPGIATLLPRPGKWMVLLRRILGILLAGTAGWLLWVLSAQTNDLTTGLVGICILVLVTGVYLNHRGVLSGGLAAATIVTGCLVALALPYTVRQSGEPDTQQSRAINDLWQPFGIQAIAEHVDNGKVVFVDVTAEWCVTCQVNKSFVLARGEVFRELSSKTVVPMQGDWTLPDRAITDYLSSHGRYGIPFNAVYGPAAPRGIVLPEILSPDTVLDALRRAGAQTAG